jgi:hypothetical protein
MRNVTKIIKNSNIKLIMLGLLLLKIELLICD